MAPQQYTTASTGVVVAHDWQRVLLSVVGLRAIVDDEENDDTDTDSALVLARMGDAVRHGRPRVQPGQGELHVERPWPRQQHQQ